MKLVFDTDLHRFQKDVLESSCPVMVDFWADWCPPCITLTPILERVVNSLAGEVKLAKIEVDEGEN
ncbi:MAG TPA: thioredoxin domain-containing protein, partial [Burkholderiales bacterium]|nr:thioredoxin domain-containing protein [Burkholderiales bacterium]